MPCMFCLIYSSRELLDFTWFFLRKVTNDTFLCQKSVGSLLKDTLQGGSTAATVQFRLPQDPAADESWQDPAEEENWPEIIYN